MVRGGTKTFFSKTPSFHPMEEFLRVSSKVGEFLVVLLNDL